MCKLQYMHNVGWYMQQFCKIKMISKELSAPNREYLTLSDHIDSVRDLGMPTCFCGELFPIPHTKSHSLWGTPLKNTGLNTLCVYCRCVSVLYGVRKTILKGALSYCILACDVRPSNLANLNEGK